MCYELYLLETSCKEGIYGLFTTISMKPLGVGLKGDIMLIMAHLGLINIESWFNEPISISINGWNQLIGAMD